MVGKSPVDRGKLGSKMTIITDEDSIPLCATFAAGNIADTTQLVPTLAAARHQLGDLARFRELVADKGYDSAANREACRRHGLIPAIIARQRRPAARNRNFLRRRRKGGPTEVPFAHCHLQMKMRVELKIEDDRWKGVLHGKIFSHKTTLRYERLRYTFHAMHFLSLSAIICKRLSALGVEE